MAGGATSEGQPGLSAGARFKPASVELEDDRLIVTGEWSDVRGLRFVRPTLLVDGRNILATLEHKPWDPSARPWVAAFPWDGPAPATGGARLSVAPSITVELSTGVQIAPRFAREAIAPPSAPQPPEPPPVPMVELEELTRVTEERDRALLERDQAIAVRDEAIAQRDAAHDERRQAIADRDEALRREASAQSTLDVLRIDATEARQSADRIARTCEEAQARADRAERDAIAMRQERDAARAAAAAPAPAQQGPIFGPLSSTRSLQPSGRQLWAARAVIAVATLAAIIFLAHVLGS